MFVLQSWLADLTLMQQTVLLTAIRGPDGLRKEHITKNILRYYRRCILYRAFEQDIEYNPWASGGGSFTGPLSHKVSLTDIFDEYFHYVDEIPHHFQLHLMHAVEILGYKHPNSKVKSLWHDFYLDIVNDAHLMPETEEVMDRRLNDNRDNWRAAENHPAK